jgi:hypothetical protein
MNVYLFFLCVLVCCKSVVFLQNCLVFCGWGFGWKGVKFLFLTMDSVVPGKMSEVLSGETILDHLVYSPNCYDPADSKTRHPA